MSRRARPICKLEEDVIVYKAFYIDPKGRLQGPYYQRPISWHMRPGAKWIDKKIDRTEEHCAPGINFYMSLHDALAQNPGSQVHKLRIPKGACIYGNTATRKRRSAVAYYVGRA